MASERFWSALDHFRWSRWGVLLFYGYLVGIFAAAVVVAVTLVSNHNLAVKANDAAMKANRSLCLQKQVARSQVIGAKQFLHDHPHGTTEFPRARILVALHNYEANLEALRDVICP